MDKTDLQIKLVDILGNELISIPNEEVFQFNKQIDLQSLAAGLYILEIKMGDEVIHRKIVKE